MTHAQEYRRTLPGMQTRAFDFETTAGDGQRTARHVSGIAYHSSQPRKFRFADRGNRLEGESHRPTFRRVFHERR